MPRNGSGVYSLPSGSTAVPNTPISSATHNAIMSDLVADLNSARPLVAGGTGASTASGARTNLGATAVGSSVFTAADAAAARTAIGMTSAGSALATAADAAAQRTALGFTAIGTSLVTAANEAAARLVLGITTVGSALATAVDAAAARVALGATTVGSSVLTAVDAAAARTALGLSAVGSALATAADAAAARTAIGMTAAGSALATAADATAQRAALGLQFGLGFESAQVAYTAGGSATLAHGLGQVPKIVQVELECVTAEAGYAIGQRVIIGSGYDDNSQANGVAVSYDTTNINLRFGAATMATVLNWGTGSRTNITPANWRYRIKAYA